MTRMLLALAAVSVLAGCVLQSQTPLFADPAASLILGQSVVTMTVASNQPGTWVDPHIDRLTLAPQGNHYVTAFGTVAFVPLGYDRFIVQYDQRLSTVTRYALATWNGHTLQSQPLDCARLKFDLRTNALVQLVDNACRFHPQVNPVQGFAVMAGTHVAATLHLTLP